MKKLIFLLSFVFAMFFTTATFASTTDNLVSEKAQIVLTETNETVELADAVARDVIVIVIITDDEIIIIIIEE